MRARGGGRVGTRADVSASLWDGCGTPQAGGCFPSWGRGLLVFPMKNDKVSALQGFMDLTEPAPLPSVTRRSTHYGRQLENTRRSSPPSSCGLQGPAQERNGSDQPAAQTRCQGDGAPATAAQGGCICRARRGNSAEARRPCTAEARYPTDRRARPGRAARGSRWCRPDCSSLPAAQAFRREGDCSPFPPAQACCRRASGRSQAGSRWRQGNQAPRASSGRGGCQRPDSRVRRGGDSHDGLLAGSGRSGQARRLERWPSWQQARSVRRPRAR